MEGESVDDDGGEHPVENGFAADDEVEARVEDEGLAGDHGYPACRLRRDLSARVAEGDAGDACRHSPISMNTRFNSHDVPTRNFKIKPKAWSVQPQEQIRRDQK